MRPRPIHGELPQSLFRIYGVPRYWTVYSLGEDWKPEPFYIGCSSNLPARLFGHWGDPISSAFRRLHAMHDSGIGCIVTVLKTFHNRRAAFDFERDQIRATAGLLNRAHARKSAVTALQAKGDA